MSKQEILQGLMQAVIDMDKAKSRLVAEEALKEGIQPFDAVSKGLSLGMKRVGEMWNAMEVFLPEVMASVQAFYTGLEVFKPHLSKEGNRDQYIGTAVFGTIFGDIHSVGKDVVIPVFQAEDFNVIDLGIDVSPEKYVDAIKQYNANIVGLGTYMSETFMHVVDVTEALKKAGVRDRVMVLCGGPSADDEGARRMGADAGFRDAWEAVDWTKQALSERRVARKA